MCAAQYAGEVACSGVIHVPVTLEIYGMRGAVSVNDATRRSSSLATGSIMNEWKACVVGRRRLTTPRASSRRSRSAIAAGAPATTLMRGPLTPANESLSLRSAWMSSADAATASIAPAAGPR